MVSQVRDIETVCKRKAVAAATQIQKWLLSIEVPHNQPLLVIYLGTGWKVFGGFPGCERIKLEEIDSQFGCLPEVKDHPNEVVYVPDFNETGHAALVLLGRPHLYQKWFVELDSGVCLEVSAKYLVRLHTEMMLYLGLMRSGRVGPFVITSAVGTVDRNLTPVGSILVVKGYNCHELDLPIQRFTVARGALSHVLIDIAMHCAEGLTVDLERREGWPLLVKTGGLKVIQGPGFEDPEFETLAEIGCRAIGMSGATACHVIRGFNLKLEQHPEAHPKKAVSAVHLSLVTDDPYRPELIETCPFAPDSPWKETHDEVLRLAKSVEGATRQFLTNLVKTIRSDHRFD